MIAIRINKLFGRLVRGIHYPFAELPNIQETESRRQMRLSRERAVWVCKVIKRIKDAQPDNNRGIEQPSLREQILNLQIEGFESSLESKDFVLKMFRQGVLLNTTVYDQTRILYARQSGSERPFIFCPNMLVTRNMFKILMEQDYNLMTLGGYGISKTISIVLFSQLSSIVNKYLYLAFSDPEEQSYLKDLKQRKLLFDVPKLFYWNMAFEGDTTLLTYTSVLKNLLYQATELSQEEKAKFQDFKSLQEFGTAMQDIYEKRKITTRFAVDQLNYSASFMRRWNVFIEESYQKEKQYKYSISSLEIKIKNEKDQTKKGQFQAERKNKYLQYRQWKQENMQKKKQLKKQLYQPAKTLKSLMFSAFGISRLKIFNSSMNIELDILKRNFDYNKITFGLHDHKELGQEQIQFSNHLSEKWGRNDFYHYFWFEIQRKLVAKGFNQSQLQTVKKKFYAKVKDQKTPKYFRLIYIRQAFSLDTSLFDFPTNLSDQQMEVRLDKIIESLHYFSLKSCLKRIEYFFQKVSSKDKQTRKIFSLMLTNVAKEKKANGKGNVFMQINLKEVDNKYFLGTQNKTRDFLHSNEYDKQFIDFSLQDNELFAIFRWTPQEYLKINEYQTLKEKYPSLSGQQIFMHFVSDYRFAGHAYQNALIKVLQAPRTFFTYQTYKYLEGKKTSILMEKYMRIENSTDFLKFQTSNESSNQKTITNKQKLMNHPSDLEKNKNKNCLYLNLSKMLIMAKNNPNKYIFGTPVQFNKNGWTFFSSNPSTDFMIISYIKDEEGMGYFLIESFDVTVTYSQSVIQKKYQKAQKLFQFTLQSQFEKVKAKLSKEEKEQFLKQESTYQQIKMTKITFTHSIICPQKIAENMEIIKNNNPDFTINFIPIESINVTCPDKELAMNQQSVKDIVLQLLNKNQQPPNKH